MALRPLIALVFSFSLAWGIPSQALPLSSLNLGSLPDADGAGVWRVAVPVEGADVELETWDARLTLRHAPANEGRWLVFSGQGVGPVSGLVRVHDVDGTTHTFTVSGEVVPGAEFEHLLLRGDRPGDRIERFVQIPGEIPRVLDVPGAHLSTCSPSVESWARVAVQLSPGQGERSGTLRHASGTETPVHVSLLESITVVGTALLEASSVPQAVRPLGERLQNGRLSGIVGVVSIGGGGGTGKVSILQATTDGGTVFLNPVDTYDLAGAAEPAYLSRVDHLGGEATGAHLLALTPELATLIHPITGVMATLADPALTRLGAVRPSRLSRNRVFAVSGDGGGEWFLSRINAQRVGGRYSVERTRYTPSLQSLLGPATLYVGDLATYRYPVSPTEFRERLLVSVGDRNGTLRIVELARDGGTVNGQIVHRIEVPDPLLLPAVQKDVLPSRIAGSAGLPVQMRLRIPGREVQVLEARQPGSWSLLGREVIGGPAMTTGVALARPSFLLAGPDGQGNTDLIRYVFDGQGLQGRAIGRANLAEVKGYVASERKRHAWLLGRDSRGRGRLHVLTNGLARGTNLPPRADAGPDVRTTQGRVSLQASARDANGDPLAVQWFGDGVEFTNPMARTTTAFVRPGRTQIGFRAYETGGLRGGSQLEARDALVVRFEDVVSADAPVSGGLVTGLGAPQPNPSPARTRLPFTLAARSHVRVQVFDVNGRLVRTLLDAVRGAGGYDVVWDGQLGSGAPAPDGVYFARLTTGDRSLERRIILVR